MSEIKKIRILYTLSLTLFIDIAWSFIVRLMFGREYDFKLFIILIVSAFSVKFIHEKINNKYISIAIPAFISLFFNFTAIYNVIVVAFLSYLVQENRESSYNFSYIESSIKNSIVVLFILGFFDGGKNIRLYVIFLIVSILLQRESRALSYGIKNSPYGNLGIAIFSLLFSVDKLFSLFLSFLKFILDLLWLPVSYILLGLMYVFSFIFSAIFKAIGTILSTQSTEEILKKYNDNSLKDNLVQIDQTINFPPFIKLAIESAIIIFFLFIIYNIYNKKEVDNRNAGNFFEIETEKISETKDRKKRKYIFGKDIKSKILYTFLSFEGLAKNKGIYKSSMTAKELGNKTKASLVNHNEIDSFVNTYNEVKFSNHEPTLKQYENIKATYQKLKKEL